MSAYNDMALATTAFAAFYLVQIWLEDREERLLIPIGLLAGFGFAIKYTGFVAVVYVCAMVWGSKADKRYRVSHVMAASAMILPWLVKNWLWLGNPVAPFFNRLFPNPYIHVSFEDSYRHYLHTYGLASLKPLFWIVTVSGQLGGQLGPLFLLAPIALLSLRSRPGRQCLLAAAFFLLPYPANIGARFLLPSLPFVALGITLAMEVSQMALAVAVIAAGFLAWPRVIDRYRAPSGGWQITHVPWKAALGIVPRQSYLGQFREYRIAEMINRQTPSNAKIWSSMALAESYIDRDVLVNYYSAEGETLQDILLTPLNTDMQPLWNLRFVFARRAFTHLRFLQSALSPDDIWSIGEARFYDGPTQVFPSRSTADLALDGNPVTRWRSWESIRPGMHLDFDFNSPVEIDRIELHCSHDQWKIAVRIEGIEAKVDKLEDPPLPDLRALATATVKSRGIRYLMVSDDHALGPDMRANPVRWNVKLAGEQGTARLYEIQ